MRFCIQRELAVHLYAEAKLSFGKAREVARMRFWELQQLLASRQIPVHYDVEEFEEDTASDTSGGSNVIACPCAVCRSGSSA